MRLAWGRKVSTDFTDKVFQMCDRFGWNRNTHASWLMSCMAFESGETFSPTILNAAGSGAVGLIQFMPATAKALGTTCDQLASMSAVQQLEFVEKYFTPHAKKISSLSDMYMAILLPKYVGQPESSTLFTDPSVAYRQNSGLDADHNGKITKLEATNKVQAKLDRGLQDRFAVDL